MTLKRHLTVVVSLVLAVVIAGFAVVIVRVTRAELQAQLGDVVRASAARDGRPPRLRGAPVVPDQRAVPADNELLGGRRVARLLFEPTGELVDFQASGFSGDPDPQVGLPPVGSPEQRAMEGRLTIRRSEDKSIRYLVVTREVANGRVRFDAISMESADNAVRRLTVAAVLAGLAATLLGSLATAFATRRIVRPVEQMVAVSERIATGDLTARSATTPSASEIGRLGTALNRMLGTIEQAVAERDAKDQELRQFIADASHELRTPITVVQGYSDLYRSGALNNRAELDRAMNRIDSQTLRMTRLVNDLLLLANLERPEFIVRTLTDVGEVAEEAASEFRLVTPYYPVSVSVSGDAQAQVDAVRIRQVFDNLLGNVREHTPFGTMVAIGVSGIGEELVITVTNSGPGISSAEAKLVFQRFWRADRGSSPTTGSGLGLAITESIVAAHGGRIRVEGGGAGTTFTIELPKA